VDGSEACGDESGKAFEIQTPTRVCTLATKSEATGLRHYIVGWLSLRPSRQRAERRGVH